MLTREEIAELQKLPMQEAQAIYYSVDALSNSALKKLHFFDQKYGKEGFEYFKEPSSLEVQPNQTMFIGREIDDAITTLGKSLERLVVLNNEKMKSLSEKELQMLKNDEDDVLTAYFKVYSNNDTRKYQEYLTKKADNEDYVPPKGERTAKERIDAAIERILNISGEYQLELERCKEQGKLVLNELDFLKNKPEIVLKAIVGGVEELYRNREARELLFYDGSDMFPFNNSFKQLSFTQLPVYYIYKGIAFKSLLDSCRVDENKRLITIVELKTSEQDVVKSYKNRAYWRQLAIYKEALLAYFWSNPNYLEAPIDCYSFEFKVVGLNYEFNESKNRVYFQTIVFDVAEHDILCAKKGGILKPNNYSNFQDSNTVRVFMNESEISYAKKLGILPKKKKHAVEYYVKGYDELIDDYNHYICTTLE